MVSFQFGPSMKNVMPFWTNFDPPSPVTPCDTSQDPLKYVTHLGPPQFLVVLAYILELDRYIGNTHHRGRLWDNRNHRNHWQMMTIGDQSVPMFHDDVTH